METVLLVVALVCSVLSLIGVIVLLFLCSRKDKDGSDKDVDLSPIEKSLGCLSGEVRANIDNMEKNISNVVEMRISEKSTAQMAFLKDEMKKQSVFLYQTSQAQLDLIRDSINKLTGENTSKLMAFEEAIRKSVAVQIKAINERIDSNMKIINERVDQGLSQGFKGASDSMISLQKQLGIVQEAQKNIDSLQNEISSLNGILSNNQQRGRYGEWQLELLLENMFEGGKGVLYETQYVIQEAKGEEKQLKPDAVIFLDGEMHTQMVCIDSKFSLVGYEDLFDKNKHLSDWEYESCKARFRSALKLRIDETSKYIIKGKTLMNSVMFVPSDGVFAYIQNVFPDVAEYARKKGVVMVSPTILQPLLASFRLIQIDAKKNKNIAKINDALNALAIDFDRFIPRWEKLSRSIKTLNMDTEKFSTTVTKIGNKFQRVQNIEFSDDSIVRTEAEEEKEDGSIQEEDE